MIKLLNIDCMDFMKDIPDKYFDLAIVDPPYGLYNFNCVSVNNTVKSRRNRNHLSRMNGAGKLKDRAINKLSTEFDKTPPTEEYFNELFRVSENQIIWGGNYFSLPPTRGIICWDKKQPWPNFSAWEMAWTSFDKPAKIFRYAKGQEFAIHPTQKPVALYKWLLNEFAQKEFKILDTHLGSGSSAVAAHYFGLSEFVGCELDENYFKGASERFEKESSQTVFDF